jgi:hypothetical protein
VTIPRDPRDLAYEKIISALRGSPFEHEFVELVRTVCKTNVFVREYIGEDFHVRTNRKLRDIRDRFVKLEDERILIRRYTPLTLAWKDSCKGGDTPATDAADDRGVITTKMVTAIIFNKKNPRRKCLKVTQVTQVTVTKSAITMKKKGQR